MTSEALVQLALNALSCSQKELAIRLGVSPTQISKWKKGEHLSQDMEEKLRTISNISDKDPEFVLWTGSLKEAIKWERLVHYLADVAQEKAETGYNTEPLKDEEGTLCWETFRVLREMGVAIPKEFPKELDFDYEADESDGRWTLIDENPYSALIHKIYTSLNDVYGFYVAYVSEFIYDDKLDLFDTPAGEIETRLMWLAACKVEVTPEFAPRFGAFKREATREYEKSINIVKDAAFRAGAPLRAELLNLVYDSNDELGHEAETESLGFNASRVHPDIYMNELLIGMRVIHQVLPALLKKLGIEKEFELDTAKLRIG